MAGAIGAIEQQIINERKKRLQPTNNIITVGSRVAPMNTGGLAQQQLQQSVMRGLYGGKKMAKKGKKETEKNEDKEWDTGFGELYESIEDRKTKKPFKSMDELLKEM
jgi:hypothetical protein